MRTVKIQGGLGNQLFGLGFARTVMRLSGEPVALDLAAYGSDRYGRGFDTGPLAARLGDFTLTRRPWRGGRIATALLRHAPWPGNVSETAPPGDTAALAALAAKGRYFNGYWQDERYIADPPPLIEAVREFVIEKAGAAERTTVALHYRSYREEIRPDAAGTPDRGYFAAALARIEARLGEVDDIVLVSDDPALARARIGDLGRPILDAPPAGPWADLRLLMRARALILSNSSFSWWGGYCGEAEIAVYPRRGRLFHYPAPAARFVCV